MILNVEYLEVSERFRVVMIELTILEVVR